MEKNNEKDLVKKPDLAIYIGNNETDIETEQIVLNEKRKHIKILACAGSGKTYLMVSKVIELIKNNKNNLNSIAVMTFTELAAKDLKKEIYCRTVENKIFKSKNETFQKLQKIFIGTIHSFCLNVIKQIKSEAINFNEMKVLNESQVKLLIYRFYKELNFNKVLPFTRKINKGFDVNSITIPDYLKLVYKACEEDIYLPKYNTSSKMPESIKNLYEKFNAFLLKRKNLTFSLILKNFIDSFKKFKEQMKELIKDIKYMIIDEYQDVNAIQEKITQIFIENNTFLYIVGDDDQAIYQFRGGNEKYLNDFEENIKLLKVKNGVLSLKKINTRRCSTGIVYLADKIVGNMILGKRCEKVFKTISKYSFEENDLTKRIYETKEEEIKSIIDLIKKYHELGVEYEHIAVITRRNVNIDDFCYAFLQNNIPYKRNENGGIFCYDKFEKEEYLAFIFLLLNKPESIKKNDNSFSVNYLKNKNKIIGNKYMTSEMFDFIENEYCKFENAEIDVEKIILWNRKFLNKFLYKNVLIPHLEEYVLSLEKRNIKYSDIISLYLKDEKIPFVLKYKGKYPLAFSLYKILLQINDFDKKYHQLAANDLLFYLFGKNDKEKNEDIVGLLNEFQQAIVDFNVNNINRNTTFTCFLKKLIKIINPIEIKDEIIYEEFLLNIEQIMKIVKEYEEIYFDVGWIQKVRDFYEFLNSCNDTYSYLFSKCENKDGEVSILTAHGSKGLSFFITFIPFLNNDIFPSKTAKSEEEEKFNDINKDEKELKENRENDEFHFKSFFDKLFLQEKDFHPIDPEVKLFYIAITRSRKYIHFSCNNENKPSYFFEFLYKESLINDSLPTFSNSIYSEMKEYISLKEDIEFSHTSLEQYDFCPQSYYFSHICKSFEKKENEINEVLTNVFANRGVLFHEFMEIFAKPRDYSVNFKLHVKKIVNDLFEVRNIKCKDIVSKKEDIINKILRYEQIFFTKEIVEHTECEKKFEWYLENDEGNNIVFKGSIDNLYVDDEKVIITDYKTSNWDVEDSKIKRQLIRYALAYVNTISVIDVLKIKLVAINLDTNKKIEYGYKTENLISLQEFEKEKKHLKDVAKELNKNISEKSFNTCLFNCNKCSFYHLCNKRKENKK